jgi:hypothetical protein
MEQRFSIAPTAKHVESVFFKDGAYDVFESTATQRARRGFLWVIPVATAFILFALDRPNSGSLIGLAAAAIIGQTTLLGLAFNNLNKQRQQVVDFAHSIEQGGPSELRVTDMGFSLTFKGAEHIERWNLVVNTTIADDHIFIRASSTYIFPRASMKDNDFVALSNIVRDHTLPDPTKAGASDPKQSIGFRSHYRGDEGSKRVPGVDDTAS